METLTRQQVNALKEMDHSELVRILCDNCLLLHDLLTLEHKRLEIVQRELESLVVQQCD